MPTYVYKFIDSGETIEVVQSFDEATLSEARHPVSGRMEAVKKVFLPVGVTFKGDGFYKTDNRGGGSKRSGSGNGEPSSSSSSTSSSAAEKTATSSASASSSSSSSTSSSSSSD